MFRLKIAAFGEAEKGKYCFPYFIRSLPELVQMLGNPPNESQGLHYAVQALLYERDLIFFRVGEEGFSTREYMEGLKELQLVEKVGHIDALCMPGVGDDEIISATNQICRLHKSLLIITEKDLYDYLTSRNLS